MSVEAAQTPGPIPRVSLSASVLLVMLLSLPISADARAAESTLLAGRVVLSPNQVLPAEIVRRLYAGIRFETLATPDRIPEPAEPAAAPPSPVRAPVLLREALLDLPPPSARR